MTKTTPPNNDPPAWLVFTIIAVVLLFGLFYEGVKFMAWWKVAFS